VHQGARWGEEIVVAVHTEGDLSGDYVERLVPGVAVGRRTGAFGPGLAEDLIASRRRAIGEDGDLLADDVEPPRAVLGRYYHRLCGHCLPLSPVLPSLFEMMVSY
jgi:hypothetical protein